jgi:mediator of RNA polymerase II transcription subunit 6
MGRTYQTAAPAEKSAKQRLLEGKECTPMPDGMAKTSTITKTTDANLDSRLIHESLRIHERYGGEYMDENPITGKPGEFHLSSTGRKEKMPAPKASTSLVIKGEALPALNTKVTENPLAKGPKETKSPKTPNMSKPKRRKSKVATTPS